jgi:hypothetical protein
MAELIDMKTKPTRTGPNRAMTKPAAPSRMAFDQKVVKSQVTDVGNEPRVYSVQNLRKEGQ